ncbi:RNA polymerase sigma factor [Roseivivax marinus]|jgi:RNA polymerase sigma-70 factor (ECF subfamily)|uniref:RNA polymerase sigma factor n=1 Tax=Roseivivax marinus TaxID=1379903 RepID=W4HIV5_9RHOB|nr:sigma-70 family RNA polymerase sigma factor [Roseivivax marinus]ETW12644.1 RNA polymerase sigma factor [Roseivivax marinus]UMA65766.1 sigma-70 family RNA polymerase sigma factor [Roseivivax marinus]SEL17535.1 RNA polymerase sigma-70 factor, ECF subfamily [Roseivivax marinus]
MTIQKTPHEEIEELLARIAMGDRKAFSALYDRTSAKLFGICLRVLGDRAEAEEALQEAYVRIWNRADAYRVNGFSPMTWLITLTRNIAVDRRRRRPARPAEALDLADTMPDTGPGPEDITEERSEAQRLHACLRELPDDRAALVRSAYLDGFTYAELSEATGIKLNTVRTWLRRSLIQLRECLAR